MLWSGSGQERENQQEFLTKLIVAFGFPFLAFS